MTSEGYHEPLDKLSERTLDHHRAIAALMEELEAVDWYDQRVEATGDEELAAILAHNRDEEKEHAIMTLEWLRRRDPVFDENMRTYLFTEGSVLDAEDDATSGDDADDAEGGPAAAATPASPGDGSLGVGSLRGDDFSL
ncbi:ferritin-like domain-containing protein [Iamia sp.]|uniref:ferritin-like domain-containing protein n=1 Tax=Iamia sp. TaxID=2722710 RepID=UPI002CBB777A|nr:ferritin-like domain-containing protein [Iamia sp.]HXH59141.1 ferritin-like domain-containing protein [Iamia sp.]